MSARVATATFIAGIVCVFGVVQFVGTGAAATPVEPPKGEPVPGKLSSRVLRSERATEAIARKQGVERALDSDRARPATLRPPLPVFSSPLGDPSRQPPALSDQFVEDYYERELPPVPPAVPGNAGTECASARDPRQLEFSWLQTAGCAGPRVKGPGTVTPMANPGPTGEWRTPGHQTVWSGEPGTIAFYDKYSDPDGEDGWLWFLVHWMPSGTPVLGTPVAGSTTVSGGQSTWFVGNNLFGGEFHWWHKAEDVSGEASGYFGAYALYVNNPPAAPTLSSPQAAASVPTPQPVLSLSGANPDPDGDWVAWDYKITTGAGCTGTIAASSGWLPMGATTWTPPLGALKDGQDYYWCVRATDFVGRHYGSADGPWSSARLLKIRLPKRGTQSYWPMFSRGPLSVNEATGNLFLAVPGPSFSSVAGSIGGGFSYNLFDTNTSVFAAATGSAWTAGVAGAPARLVDHNLLTGDAKFDAVERVEADGTSSYYAHVAGGNTYQAGAGDPSILAKAGTGFVLTDPDGSIYTFGTADPTTGVAPVTQAQVSSTATGQAQIDYTFDGSGRPDLIVAKAKDSGGTLQTLQSLDFEWTCSGALVCITGPDTKKWKYVGDATGGTTGKLASITNDTREILRIGYDGSGRPNSIKNANDLNPTAASPGHTSTHELQISYDATTGKVASVVEKAVRDRYYSATSRDLTWSFAYSSAGSSTCPQTARTAHSPDSGAGHTAATRTIAGCTDITLPEPKASNGNPNRISVFYDQLAHPVETIDALGNYALAQWTDRNTLEWTEDELKQPTDNAYDSFTNTLTSSTGPDPDGAGPLPRPLTRYFYDEQAPGNGTTAGTALQGLQAFYYKNTDLTGRPETIQNDSNVDFDWTASGPAALGGQKTNIGVRWSGTLSIPAQADYVLATKAEAGTRLVVDGIPLIDKWTGQAFATPQCSPLTNLKAGKHSITLEYHQTASTDTRVQLLWTNGGTATCANATTVVASSALTPNWQNQTSTTTLDSTSSGSGNRLAFNHYANPASRQPDYSVADATNARLISSFSYDNFGRRTQRVLPKGNASRTIAGNGDLSGSVVSGHDVSYSSYAIGETAAACGGSAVNQLGLPKSITPYGITPTTTTYDALGRSIAITKAAGTTCRSYDAEHRLTSEQAPGEAQPSTYAYDPIGLVRTVADGSGTLTTIYNESGLVIDSIDSYGAEMEAAYNKDGNPSKRRVATGSLSTSTVYDTDYLYNDNGQLAKQIFLPSQSTPAARTYEFSWDARGQLKATRYPNGTFSWNDYLANGALQQALNRHGSLSSPPPATGAPPTDANALSDFAYSYYADGRRASETRTGESLGSGETTTYGYDSVGRLNTVSGAINNTYCYDLNSNRIKLFSTTATGSCASGTPDVSYAYSSSAIDQLATVTPQSGSPTTYGYDSDGQTTARGGDTIGWDSRGRHNGASVQTPIPLTGVQFTVDGTNHGAPVTTYPYATSLDTTGLSAGWHTLGATATASGGKQANPPSRVVKVAQPVTPTVYGAATLEDTSGPSLTSPSVTTTAAADVVLTAYAQDQSAAGSFAPSAPAGLELAGQRWATQDIGVALFAENRATAAAGAHTVTQSSGTSSRGAATAALALHAPSGSLVRRSVSTRAGDANTEGGAIVDRPSGLESGDLIVAAVSLNDNAAGLTVTEPSGWTPRGILRSGTGGTQTLALFTKVAGSSEPSSYTFTVSGGVTTNYQNSTIAAAYTTQPTAPPTVYAMATLQDTSGPSLVSASATTTANADLVLSAFVQDQTGTGVFAASAPAGLTLLSQQWSTGNDIGIAAFEETRATAGAGTHTATQNSGSLPSRGAATGILALHAPSGQLVRHGVAARANPASSIGNAIVDRPANTVAGDLLVALIGLDESSSVAVAAPDGSWSSRGLLQSTTGGGQTLAIFTKITSANEPNSYTFTASTNGGISGPNYNIAAHSTIAITYAAVSELTAPTAPGTPTITTTTPGKASLNWGAATDASGIAYYRIHRSNTTGFTAGPTNEIAQTTAASYTDAGDGSTNGLPAGTWYYKLIAIDLAGNASASSGQGSGSVSADTALPRTTFFAPTPTTMSTVSGTVGLAVNAIPPATTTTVSYGFDAIGFRRSRTSGGQSTRYLLGGVVETDGTGAITSFDVDGPAGDLARYGTAPTAAANPSYAYYSGHGDLAAEASHNGTRTRLLRIDPWGQPLTTPGSGVQELFTGRWDKKHDQATSLIEMGVRPYDPIVGRFLSADPVDGGSYTVYDYADQDPVNSHDLSGNASNAYVIADGGDCWATCFHFRRYMDPQPVTNSIEKVAETVAKYGGTCAWGAATGGLASGPGGALIGCGANVGLAMLASRGGRVGRTARVINATLLIFDARRIVYNRLGVPTVREIVYIYRAGGKAPSRTGP